MPPVRDEEHEIQRKAHAKRVRETRRSTQGDDDDDDDDDDDVDDDDDDDDDDALIERLVKYKERLHQ